MRSACQRFKRFGLLFVEHASLRQGLESQYKSLHASLGKARLHVPKFCFPFGSNLLPFVIACTLIDSPDFCLVPFPSAMSHLAVLTPSFTSTDSPSHLDHTAPVCSPVSSKFSLIPEGFSCSRSTGAVEATDGVQSLPASPVTSAFPQRPVFRRSATSSASAFVSTSQEASRYGGMHYAQTHFSRSTLLVQPESESLQQVVKPAQQSDEDIQELLLSNTDEDESSQPPSTPGLEARIPPRGSSATSFLSSKESVESDNSSLPPAQASELVVPQAPSKRHSSNCLHQVHTWLAKIPARV